eukprot:gene10563-3082_t
MSGTKNINVDHLKELDDLEDELEDMNNIKLSENEKNKIDKSREETLKQYHETVGGFKKYMLIPFFVGVSASFGMATGYALFDWTSSWFISKKK